MTTHLPPDSEHDMRILFEVLSDTQNAFLNDRVWTGIGNLTFGGQTYTGIGSVVDIAPAPSEMGAPSSRMTLVLAASDPAVRAAAFRDPGPRKCRLRWIYSTDEGATWTAVPRQVSAILSSPVLGPATYSLTLELETGERDPNAPKFWSDQDFLTRDAAYKGGRFAQALEEGLFVEWPPL